MRKIAKEFNFSLLSIGWIKNDYYYLSSFTVGTDVKRSLFCLANVQGEWIFELLWIRIFGED
jgi:hypothetical protein